MRMINTLNLSI